MTVILGIDGSLTATGWTRVEVRDNRPLVIDESCVRTAKHKGPARIYAADDDGRRVDEIATAIGAAMRHADFVAVEAPAGSRNAKTAKALGLVYGCVRALACMHGKPIIVVQAGGAKKAMTGNRLASKEDVQRHAALWLGPLGDAFSAIDREAIADARAVVRAAMESPVMRGGAV